MVSASTRDRILDVALLAFGTRGYDATSLDSLAGELGVRKQTILYYLPSKEALLDAVIDRAGAELVAVLEGALARPGEGWDRVDAVVRSVFRLAGRRPELLGLLREVSRLGPPAATRFREMLGPFVDRATGFLEDGMAAGELRRQDGRLLLLATYSMVIGVATEVEVLRALGVEPTARTLVRQRATLLAFLRSALVPVDGGPPATVGVFATMEAGPSAGTESPSARAIGDIHAGEEAGGQRHARDLQPPAGGGRRGRDDLR